MKLAELLNERKTLSSKSETLLNDIAENSIAVGVSEKEALNATIKDLIKCYTVCIERHSKLSSRISTLNSKVKVVGYDMTITQALSKKEALLKLVDMYNQMLSSVSTNRYGRLNKEAGEVPSFDVNVVRKLRDGYSASARKLDVAIQGTNWIVEIVPGTPSEGEDQDDLLKIVYATSNVGDLKESELEQTVYEEVYESEETEVETEVPVEEEQKEVVVKSKKKMEISNEEVSKREKKMLQIALKKAQDTPREKDPNCPIDNSPYSDYIHAVYDVYRDVGKMVEFMESTDDERIHKLPNRVIQNFVNRNFFDAGEVYNPQL